MAQTMSGQWSYPLEETNGNARPPPKRGDTHSSQESQSKSVRRTPSDVYNVMSDSEGTKQRRASLKAGNATASKKRSRNTLRESRRDKVEERVDDSAWIHRDKLAQIEIQEMEEAGIPVRQSRRSLSAGPDASARSSRSASRHRRPVSKDQPNGPVPDDMYGASYAGYENFEPKRVSTILAAEEEDQDFDPTIDTEFRTPEEVMAEQQSIRSNVIRPSTSRIPVSKASPVPVPPTVVGRDSPLPRSRNGSGAWSGNWDEMQYARRARGNSIGSQVMYEDGVGTPPRPGSSYMRSSDENSPPKSRVPNKSTPNGRKSSTQSSTHRPNSSQKTDRPVSRGAAGHKSRPSTSHQHAPEGEAPWIASMYKPDPRLPPDQQMLPTHAKRMMQEQWEREGQTGTAYDRALNLINNDAFPEQKPLPPAKPQSTNLNLDTKLSPLLGSPSSTNMNAWPLTPKSSDQRSETGSLRPGTSGGYKITPTIQSPPAIQKSPSPSPNPMQSPPGAQHNVTPRVPDYDEKQDVGSSKKKGGCGCCVVM